MSPSIENSLSHSQCREIMLQVFRSPEFRPFNQHLTKEELANLSKDPIAWPEKPVFSPYAAAANGYTQVRATINVNPFPCVLIASSSEADDDLFLCP